MADRQELLAEVEQSGRDRSFDSAQAEQSAATLAQCHNGSGRMGYLSRLPVHDASAGSVDVAGAGAGADVGVVAGVGAESSSYWWSAELELGRLLCVASST